MTRCLTAAVLAAALLAVVGVVVGYRRGREVPWAYSEDDDGIQPADPWIVGLVGEPCAVCGHGGHDRRLVDGACIAPSFGSVCPCPRFAP